MDVGKKGLTFVFFGVNRDLFRSFLRENIRRNAPKDGTTSIKERLKNNFGLLDFHLKVASYSFLIPKKLIFNDY